MFCPRCAAENGSEQAYCRQCGLALADVGLALQGTASESLAKLRSGSHLINGGIATITVFMLVAVLLTLISITQGHPVLTAIAMLNALVGAAVGLPLIITGKTRVSKATRLLSGKESTRAIDAPQSEPRPLPPPGSVTDHTTLDLSRHRKT